MSSQRLLSIPLIRSSSPSGAELAFNGQALRDAVSAMERLTDSYAHFFRALLRLGKGVSKEASWLQAEKAFMEALSLAPRSTAQLLAGFRSSLGSGKPVDSSAALDQIGEAAAGLAGNYLELGRVLRDTGSFAEAAACFDRAAALQPRDPEPRLEGFIVELGRGRLEAAVARAEAVLDLRPQPVHIERLCYPFGEKLAAPWDRKRLGELSGRLADFARRQPSAVLARYFRFAAQLVLDKREVTAEQLDDLARRATGRYLWIGWPVGNFHVWSRRWEAGLANLAPVQKAYPSIMRVGLLMADALLGLGRVDEALGMFRSQEPEQGKGAWLAFTGELFLRLGRYAEAVSLLDRARAAGEAPLLVDSWRGGALLRLGRLGEAGADLTRAVGRLPNDVEAYNWRGLASRLLGRRSEALADFERAQALFRGDAFSLANRALLAGDRRRWRAMREDFSSVQRYLSRTYGASCPKRWRASPAAASPGEMRSILESVIGRLGDWLAAHDDMPAALLAEGGSI